MMVVTSNVDGARDICLVSPEKVGGSGPVVVDMCWWWWWVLFILGNPIKFYKLIKMVYMCQFFVSGI